MTTKAQAVPTPSTSPLLLVQKFLDRKLVQAWRKDNYERLFKEFKGSAAGANGRTRGQYGDGRPAMQYLQDTYNDIDKMGRGKGLNILKPIVEDRVATLCPLPTIIFDPPTDDDAGAQQADLCSRAVRAQYDLSQMAVNQVYAVFYTTLMGETCYTLDPLRPSEQSDNPFSLPGVRINVQDPTNCYPSFGTGPERGRIQTLYMHFEKCDRGEAEALYPEVARLQGTADTVDLLVYYDKDAKRTIAFQEGPQDAIEVYRDDHKYGFCTAEWSLNKIDGSQFGVSEIDDVVDLNHSAQTLFAMATDGVALATYPPIVVKEAAQVNNLSYGPLSVIETTGEGSVTPLQSNVNVQVPLQLLDTAKSNLLSQTGTSPIRQDMNIQHSNTSGRAINSAQGPMQARLNMANILVGSSLEWVNSKVAMILYKDPEFKKTTMTITGVEHKGKRTAVTFIGEDLGGLWRNHVQWGDPLASNKQETLVQYLQLYKENLVPGTRVLEAIGEEDPPRLMKQALAEKAAMQQQQPQQGAPPGGPGQGSPSAAADQNVAMGAGALGGGGAAGPGGPPVQPPPAAPPPPAPSIPNFTPQAAAPGGAPAGMPPLPVADIVGEVQQAAAQLPMKGEILSATTTPRGILVTVSDFKDRAMLKTALLSLAQQVAGAKARVDIQVQK